MRSKNKYEKTLSTLIILIFSTVLYCQNKPSLSPSLSIWGKLLEYRSDEVKCYFRIQAEFINGQRENNVVELYANSSDYNLELNKSYYFYFKYPRQNSSTWNLQINDGGFKDYKTNMKIHHINDIRFFNNGNTKFNIGWNKVCLLISNNCNDSTDIKFKEIRLLNYQAFGKGSSFRYMDMNDRVKNAEITGYKIINNSMEITIPPYLKYILELEVFVGKDYNVNKEYYLYNNGFDKKVDTLKTSTAKLIIWGNIEYTDELGNTHKSFEEYPLIDGTLFYYLHICPDKNGIVINPGHHIIKFNHLASKVIFFSPFYFRS